MTSAPRKGSNASDEANRRDEIVRASARLFREKGFDATTVRDIAAAVGMQSGSPFYHFGSKQDILLAVMEQGLREGLERTEAAVDPALPAPERLRALVRTHLGILHDDGSEFIAVMLYEWRSLPAEHRGKLMALKDRYDSIWQRTLEDLHALGRLGADPKLARLMILGAVNFSATWYRPEPRGRGAMSLDCMADETTRLFIGDGESELTKGRAALRGVRAELQSVQAELQSVQAELDPVRAEPVEAQAQGER